MRLYRALGDRLRRLRENTADSGKRLTQDDLARRVGLERTSITNIEKGNQKVPLHVLYRMCEVFGVSTEQVLPTLAEVRPEAAAPAVEAFEFSGRQYMVPTSAASVITKIVADVSGQ